MINKIIFFNGNFNKVLNFEGKPTIFELLSKLPGLSDTSGASGASDAKEIKLDFPCGGKKTCKKCKVKITSGFEYVSELCETEKKSLSPEEIENNIRFACMCEVFGDVEVELNREALIKNKMEIQTTGVQSINMTADKYKKVTVQSNGWIKPTLENPIPDDINFRDTLNNMGYETAPLSVDIIKKIAEIRNNNIAADVIINNAKVTDVRPAGECKDVYGAAADIGTTTVAVYLYSVTSGELIGTASGENPQRTYGADVISRINYIIENENKTETENEENQDGLYNLKNLILSLIFKLIDDVCGEYNICPKDVYSVVLTGNTVMQHIAAGISPKNIAFTPFIASTLFDFDINLGAIINRLETCSINENAVIYFPPAFASYVGGDIAAGIIASDTDLNDKTRLFLDIGTNGEIGLGNKNALVFCATATGPAFEGAHIKLGMAGIKGAVNKIYLDNNKIMFETIGGETPKGICGSGIIDAVALMLEIGVLDETGKILDADEAEEEGIAFIENLCEIDGENIFMLNKEYSIYITQKDIRAIQLAKAAVCAGIITLLHYSGKSLQDVDELILAGGFGAHINKKSACKIGLIPVEFEEKIIAAGNTAGMGAAAVLLNSEAEKRIRRLSGISKYIELSGDKFFMDEYVDRMMF